MIITPLSDIELTVDLYSFYEKKPYNDIITYNNYISNLSKDKIHDIKTYIQNNNLPKSSFYSIKFNDFYQNLYFRVSSAYKIVFILDSFPTNYMINTIIKNIFSKEIKNDKNLLLPLYHYRWLKANNKQDMVCAVCSDINSIISNIIDNENTKYRYYNTAQIVQRLQLIYNREIIHKYEQIEDYICLR